MNKIKSFFAVVLMASMAVLPVAAHAEPEYAKNDILLEKLGILDYFEPQDFEEEKIVTRAEFAVVLAKMNGEKFDFYSDYGSRFSDVSSKHYAANAINFVSENGYMVGGGDSCFYPEREITLIEALKSLTVMLGYAKTAEYNGGYPMGYYSVASETDLLDGISLRYNSFLNCQDLKQIVYNSLFCEVQLIKVEGMDSLQYKNTGETLLNIFFGIYETEGIVKANGVAALADSKKVNENQIVIGNDVFYIDSDSDCLGCNVTAFYKENDDEKEIFCMYKNNKNESVRLCGDDIYLFESGKIMYENETEHGSIKLDSEYDILKNNTLFTSSYVPSELFKKGDFITFIDNDKDKRAEVIVIESGISGVVQKVDAEELIIIDTLSNVTCLEKCSRYDIFDKDGGRLGISDLKPGDVYTVYGETPYYVKIIKSDESVSGIISLVNEDGVEIDGRFIKYNFDTYASNYFKPGTYVKLLLDHNGLIVDCSLKNTDFTYGYIKKAWIDEDDEKTVRTRIMKDDGNFEVFDAEKLSIDKATFRNAADICSYIDALSYKLVRYRVDDQNKLVEIDTVLTKNEPEESRLRILFDCYGGKEKAETYKYVTNQRSFMGKSTIKSNVKVFIVPENDEGADSSEYSVMNADYIKNEQSYSFVSFNSSDSNVEAEAVMMIGAAAVPVKYNTSLTLVSDICQIVNEGGETVYQIKGYTDAKEVTVYTEKPELIEKARHANNSEKSSCVEKGDIVRFTKNSDNEIIDLDILYDKSMGREDFQKGFLNNSMLMGEYYENICVACTNIYGIYSDVLQTAPADYDMSKGYNRDMISNYILSNFKIFTVEKNNVREGKKSELYDYVHNSDMSSHCILYTRWGEGKMLVIYK